MNLKALKKKFSEHNTLIKNFSYLSILQIFNLLLPLLTFPYLIRVLGKETYGLVIYAQAIITYLTILINFGFNISATKDVALNRNNPSQLSFIVSSVLTIKIILFLISFLVLIIPVYLIHGLKVNAELYLITMGVGIYETMFPIWYFQGKEEMKYITYINLISRGIFTLLIFVIIKSPNDYLLVPTLNTLGALIAAIISVYIVFYRDALEFKIPSSKILWGVFRNSAPFFFSRATGVVMARSNTVLIGSFLGYTEVAYYDLAVKISELLKVPAGLINQTIYPRISVTKNMKMVLQVIKYNFALAIILYLSVFILITPIIHILGGAQMIPAKYVILLLSTTAPIVGISYFLGNTVLVVNDHYSAFNRSVIYAASTYIILVSLIIILKACSIYTFTFSIILSSLFEVGYRYFYIKRHKLF